MNITILSRLIGREAELVPVPVTVRYPYLLIRKEVIKGSIGLVFCLGILVFLSPAVFIAWLLAIVAALFAYFVFQQVMRFPMRLEVEETGVTRVNGDRREVFRWQELSDMRLNYYPNGRKADKGNLTLILNSGKQRLKVDSTLDHFPTLLSRTAQAAREQQLELHPTTQNNLEKLGL